MTAEQEKERRVFLTTGLWGWLSRAQAHDAGLAEEAAGDARPASPFQPLTLVNTSQCRQPLEVRPRSLADGSLMVSLGGEAHSGSGGKAENVRLGHGEPLEHLKQSDRSNLFLGRTFCQQCEGWIGEPGGRKTN